MKYIKLTLEYLKKRKILLLISAVFGVALTAGTSSGGFFAFIADFFNGDARTFGEVYVEISPLTAYPWYFTLGAFVVFLLLFSYIVGVIDRDMKVGKLKLGSPLRRINENVFAVLPCMFTTFVLEEAVNLLTALVASAFIMSASKTFAFIMTILIYFVLQSLVVLFLSMSAMWIPEMTTCGLRAGHAFSSAVELVKGKVAKIFVGVGTFALPAILLSVLGAFVPTAVQFILSAVVITGLIAVVPPYIYATYYDVAEMDREDLNPVNNLWNR